MAKHISDLERLTQLTLNRKYAELEQRDKEIKELKRKIEILNLQRKEDTETIKVLCKQLAYLSHKQREDAQDNS